MANDKYKGFKLEELLNLASSYQAQAEVYGPKARAGLGFKAEHESVQAELDQIWIGLLEKRFEVIRASLKLVGKGPQPFQDRNAKLVFEQGQNKFEIMLWVLRDHYPELYTKVRRKMTHQISFFISTNFLNGQEMKECVLAQGIKLPFAALETSLSDLDLSFPSETWEKPQSPWLDERHYRKLNEGARPIAITIGVKGQREGEWSGSYTYSFDLSIQTPDEIRQALIEPILKASADAVRSYERKHLADLVEKAASQFFGGKYSAEWIRRDSRYTSPFGGREGYEWQLQEDMLLLFNWYYGIPKGVDGHNRPSTCIVAIRVGSGDELELVEDETLLSQYERESRPRFS